MKLFNPFKRFLPKPPALLGLSLNPASLQLVELERTGDDYLLRHCSQTPIDSPDFSFTHPEFVEFLKQIIQKSNITTRQVALSLPYQSVLFKSIDLDKKLTEAEIALQVRSYAEQYFNYPLSELMMDFELLGPSQNHPDLREVRWVAARRSEVEVPINALANGGLSVVAVEVDSFSLARTAAYYIQKYALQQSKVKVVQVYPTHLLAIVLHQNLCIYTRVEPYTASQFEPSPVLSAFGRVLQLFQANEVNPPSLALLAGDIVAADLPDHIQSNFGIDARYLDVFSLLNFSTSLLAHEFSISAGLAMRAIS